MTHKNDEHFEFLKKAFAKDGFKVKSFQSDNRLKGLSYVTDKGYMEYKEKIGILAEHQTAVNSVTGEPKRAYYLEGTHYQMGFLLGLMAEPLVERMITEFAENIVLDFFKSDEISQVSESYFNKLKELFVELIGNATEEHIGKDIPKVYKDELNGIYDGCKEVNPKHAGEEEKKDFIKKLWAINFGHDLLMAHIYTGEFFVEKDVPHYLLKTPIMCNAYSLCGEVVEGKKHYFGRDFMFPTANVYQDMACLIIYNPAPEPPEPPEPPEKKENFLPCVSQTAPGIIGSMAAMNIKGISIGVDMSPSALCRPDRPGINSLALNRDCIEHCATLEELVDHMVEAPRGVSWLYPAADGKTDRACIIEAGCNIGDEPFPYFKYLPDYYKTHLEEKGLDENFITQMREQYGTPAPRKGLIPRWTDYNYPMEYMTQFNRELWHLFNTNPLYKVKHGIIAIIKDIIMLIFHSSLRKILKTLEQQLVELFKTIPYYPDRFNEHGYINPTWKDKLCPGPFYFAPQRETLNNVVVVSNHNITPEMRLAAMNEWVAFVAGSELNDIQWRYDELNEEVLQAIANSKDPVNPQPITPDKAWKIINFLSPEPGYNFNTYRNPNGVPWKTIQVHGSVSLFELKEKKIKSLFGYYGDEPVEITLPNYFEKPII